jgi:hypothetical protein
MVPLSSVECGTGVARGGAGRREPPSRRSGREDAHHALGVSSAQRAGGDLTEHEEQRPAHGECDAAARRYALLWGDLTRHLHDARREADFGETQQDAERGAHEVGVSQHLGETRGVVLVLETNLLYAVEPKERAGGGRGDKREREAGEGDGEPEGHSVN